MKMKLRCCNRGAWSSPVKMSFQRMRSFLVTAVLLFVFVTLTHRANDFWDTAFEDKLSFPQTNIVSNHLVTVNPRLPIINHLTYTYPINQKFACLQGQIDIFMPVHSTITNYERRAKLRESNQGKFAAKRPNALMLFFVGMPSHLLQNTEEFHQKKLQKEVEKYHDIIQMNVTDVYRNIVYKAIGVLNWINTYCSSSKIVLKTDDDVHIETPALLLSIYERFLHHQNFIIGELRLNKKPFRNKEILKFAVSVEEYPNSTFPPFVAGPAIGYPTRTARLLYEQALRTKILWLDDVFVTGVCRQALGIPGFNDSHFNVRNIHARGPPLTKLKPVKDFVFSEKLLSWDIRKQNITTKKNTTTKVSSSN